MALEVAGSSPVAHPFPCGASGLKGRRSRVVRTLARAQCLAPLDGESRRSPFPVRSIRFSGLAVSKTLLVVLIALSLGACGGDDPAAPLPPAPNIVGAYQGVWRFILAYAPAGGDQDIICPGSLTVDSQSPDGTFTGSWNQQQSGADCNEASGTLSGLVASDGTITVVSLSSGEGGSGTTLEEVTEGECVATRFDDAYRGSADGDTFEISYAISGDCGQGREVSWVTSFSGIMDDFAVGHPHPWRSDFRSGGLPIRDCALKPHPVYLRASLPRTGSETALRGGG